MTATPGCNRDAVQHGFDSCAFVGHLGIALLDCGPRFSSTVLITSEMSPFLRFSQG